MVNGLDMKVLRAVHTLTQSGSVSRAADILGVTPGPVTYLISKARKATDSALFFRSRRGMAPDTRARELNARYQSFCLEFHSTPPAASVSGQLLSAPVPRWDACRR